MGAKESPEMKEARRLVIEEKLTPYAAAKRAGVSRQSIYMSAWYKKLEKPNPEGQ
jgi:DNA-binding XRE family transcriptional regulator